MSSTAIAALAPLPGSAPPTRSDGEPADGFASALQTARTAPAEGHTNDAADRTSRDGALGAAGASDPESEPADEAAALAAAVSITVVTTPVAPLLVPVVGGVTGENPEETVTAAPVTADLLAALLAAQPASSTVATATAAHGASAADAAAAVLATPVPTAAAGAGLADPNAGDAPTAETGAGTTAGELPADTDADADADAGRGHAPQPRSAGAHLESILTGAAIPRGDAAMASATAGQTPAETPQVTTASAAATAVAPDAPAPVVADGAPSPLTAPALAAAPSSAGTTTPVREVPLTHASESVSAMLQMAARDGVHRAKLNLRPATLGGVEIRMQHTSAGVIAQVVADNPEAARMLAAAGADLRRSLEAQGITVLSLDVSTSGEQHPGAASAGDRQDHGDGSTGGRADVRTDAGGVEDTGAPADEAVRTVQLPDGVLVDVLA